MNGHVFLVTAGLLLAGSPALAHKATDNHSHCSVGGKGVKVEGKTDAARKKACGTVAESKWDEKVALPVDPNAGKGASTTQGMPAELTPK